MWTWAHVCFPQSGCVFSLFMLNMWYFTYSIVGPDETDQDFFSPDGICELLYPIHINTECVPVC